MNVSIIIYTTAICFLQIADGKNNHDSEKIESYPKNDFSPPEMNFFSAEESQALFHYINEELIDRLRLMGRYYVNQAKEGKVESQKLDFSDSFWIKGLKDIMGKNFKSPWFNKLPLFYQKQLEIQNRVLTKLSLSQEKHFSPGIIEKLFDSAYEPDDFKYSQELKKYGFRNNDEFFGRFSLYNSSLAREASSIVLSKFTSEENVNYLNAQILFEAANLLEKRMERIKNNSSEETSK